MARLPSNLPFKDVTLQKKWQSNAALKSLLKNYFCFTYALLLEAVPVPTSGEHSQNQFVISQMQFYLMIPETLPHFICQPKT
jgi:hypothetical protein